ncbi:MAG: energy-coupling factor transporter transmembrane protein EcfT [Haloplanus sp.]
MLSYVPGDSLAHRLGPRVKLAVQAGVAVAAFAHTTPAGLAALTGVTAVVLYGSRTGPLSALSEVWLVLPFLLAGPLLEGLRLGPPWFSVAAARFPALASYRTVLLLVTSTAYVRTTRVRDSRAAVQWLLPGRPGQLLGMGVAFVFRFLPVLQRDLGQVRSAMRARLGGERPIHDRMRLVAVAGIDRALSRSDTFALALQARCFSWNPTLPPLELSRLDVPALCLAVALVASAAL